MALSKTQLQHLEKRLHEERTRLVDQLNTFADDEAAASNDEQSGDLSKYPTHQADVGSEANTEEVETSIATRVSAEIAEIDAALDRITSSPITFGIDEETGEAIPFERLDIVPYARIGVR